jgi:hypothetical protein
VGSSSFDHHLIDFFKWHQADPHALAPGRWDVLADIISANRKFTMAAVDKNGELYRGRATYLSKGIESCPDGSPGKEDIIN